MCEYAGKWLAVVPAGPTTLERQEGVIDNHIICPRKHLNLRFFKPSTVQGWVRKFQDEGFEPSTIGWFGRS